MQIIAVEPPEVVTVAGYEWQGWLRVIGGTADGRRLVGGLPRLAG